MDSAYLPSSLRLMRGVVKPCGTPLFPAEDDCLSDFVKNEGIDVVGLGTHDGRKLGDDHDHLEMIGDGALRCCHVGEMGDDIVEGKGWIGVPGIMVSIVPLNSW